MEDSLNSNLCLCGCGQPVQSKGARYRFNHHQYHSETCSKCAGPRKAKFAGGLCEKCYNRKVVADSGTHPCACGCGELIPKIYDTGKPRLYKKCHNLKGEKNVRWKGGVRIDRDGYRYILKPDHPFCDHAGYVPEHRDVLEKKIGRYLARDEVAHHDNEIVWDNRPENIMLMTDSEHKSYHSSKRNKKGFGINFQSSP